MIRTLQKKLTVYCSIFIILVISLLCAVFIYISYNNLSQSYFSMALNDINNIYTILYEDIHDSNIISYSELSKYIKKGYCIYIYEDDSLISYEGSKIYGSSEDLIDKIKETAQTKYAFPSSNKISGISHVKFNYKYTDGSHFYTSVGKIEYKFKELNTIILLPTDELLNETMRTAILFICICIPAIAVLCIASYIFIGRLLIPIESSKRSQTEFIAAASHELRAPLTVIMSSIQVLKTSDEAEAKHHTDVALSECLRMSDLIKDLLNLAKADSHAWEMQFEYCHVEDILIECYSHFEELVLKKDLTFNIQFPENPLPMYVLDKNRILQLLIILIDNAISYTEKGSITLATYEKHSTLYFSVADTGIGIPDEEKTRIFNRFYSIDHSHSNRNHYGLGLSVAKEIVNAHNGIIRVTDTAGGGTTFTIEIENQLSRCKRLPD